MNKLIYEIDTMLDALNDLMLPASLADCFEAYRGDLLKKACRRQLNDNHRSWFLREISLLRGEPITSLAQAFDPYLHISSGCDTLPPGTAISLPPLPIAIVDTIRDCGELNGLATEEIDRLGSRLSMYAQDEVQNLGQLALAGYVSDLALPTRDSMVRFIAVNASAAIEKYLLDNPLLWSAVPRRHIQFPDMVALRHKQLAEEFALKTNGPLCPNRQTCYTDEEIGIIANDIRVAVFLPKPRHLATCRSCLRRILQRQAVVKKYNEVGERKFNDRPN
jgi:hypothetical protein